MPLIFSDAKVQKKITYIEHDFKKKLSPRGDAGGLSLRKIRQELFVLSISLGESEKIVNFAYKLTKPK